MVRKRWAGTWSVLASMLALLGLMSGRAQAGRLPVPQDEKKQAEKPDTSPPAVNPGRPTLTDPASLTAPGWLESEIGIQQSLNRDRGFGTPLLLKLTGRGRLQYRLATDGYVRQEDRTDGFGDVYAGLHYLFADQRKVGFDMAGRFTLKIPTARGALGTKKFDFNALLLASRDFTKWGLHSDFNAGLSSLTRQAAPGTDTQLFLSASFSAPIRGGRWLYTNEVTYFSPIAGQREQVTMMHGFVYAVHRYDAYDVALQWGLRGNGATFQVLFGRTFFFGRLF